MSWQHVYNIIREHMYEHRILKYIKNIVLIRVQENESMLRILMTYLMPFKTSAFDYVYIEASVKVTRMLIYNYV